MPVLDPDMCYCISMNDPYREPVLADVSHAGSVATSYIPKEISDMADRIARQQNCKATIAKERSGYQLYLPCPACLASHGRKELKEPKYAINLSKYFGIGDNYGHLQEMEAQDENPRVLERMIQNPL